MSKQNQAAAENSQTSQAANTDQQGQAPEANPNADTGLGEETLLSGGEQQQQQQQTPEVNEFLGAPEDGYNLEAYEEMDAAVKATFSDVAKELNLSDKAAQLMLDKMTPVMQQRSNEQLQQMRQEWAASSQADTEFGGEKLNESLGYAKRALDTHASSEFRMLLEDSGLGNHPEVIRFMTRVGKTISEDKFVTGGQSSKAERDLKALYPKTYLKQ